MSNKHQVTVVVAGLAWMAVASVAHAGGLGIPLTGWLVQFTQFIVGLGFPVGLLGLAGWAAAHLSNTFGAMIGGSINLFATAGLLGGGTAIMGALGLAAGAMLP